MADAALRLFQAHLGQGLPYSFCERTAGSVEHAPELQLAKLVFDDASDKLDAVEFGVVRTFHTIEKFKD